MIGDANEEVPGKTIVFPNSGEAIAIKKMDLIQLKRSYLKRYSDQQLSEHDLVYLADELKTTKQNIITWMEDINETKNR